MLCLNIQSELKMGLLHDLGWCGSFLVVQSNTNLRHNSGSPNSLRLDPAARMSALHLCMLEAISWLRWLPARPCPQTSSSLQFSFSHWPTASLSKDTHDDTDVPGRLMLTLSLKPHSHISKVPFPLPWRSLVFQGLKFGCLWRLLFWHLTRSIRTWGMRRLILILYLDWCF